MTTPPPAHPGDLLAAFEACDRQDAERRLRNATDPSRLRALIRATLTFAATALPDQQEWFLAACDADSFQRNEALRTRRRPDYDYGLPAPYDDVVLRIVSEVRPEQSLESLAVHAEVAEPDLFFLAIRRDAPTGLETQDSAPTQRWRVCVATALGVHRLRFTVSNTAVGRFVRVEELGELRLSGYERLREGLLERLTAPSDPLHLAA